METSMRPGVFTSYNVTNLRTSLKGRAIGIVGRSTKSIPNNMPEIMQPITILEAEKAYGSMSNIVGLIETVMDNLQCNVYSIGVELNNMEHYKLALDKLIELEDVYCIVSDSLEVEFALYAKSRLPLGNGPKLYIAPVPPDANVAEYASSINCERIALSYPVIKKPLNFSDISPALLASLISLNPSSTMFLSGRQVLGIYRFYGFPTEAQKNAYIKGGVCVFEAIGEQVQLIRGVSSKTRTDGGVLDNTYRDLAVITGLDEINVALSTVLKQRIQGAAGIISLEAINSIVLSELIGFKDRGTISNFLPPLIVPSSEDPSICIITLCITLRHTVNQIYLNLNIAV